MADNNSINIDELANNREFLIRAEIGAWLHMIGKYHEEFIKGNHYIDKKIPDEINNKFSLSLLKEIFTDQKFICYNKQISTNISSLIKEHRDKSIKDNIIVNLVIDSHGRGSGSDKGIFDNAFDNQNNNFSYSTSFGFEKLINIECITKTKNKLYYLLQNFLSFYSLYIENQKNLKKTLEWKLDFVKVLENIFSKSFAESRLPINDVTLWDQTASTVAFFKSEIAQTLLDETFGEKKFDKENLEFGFLKFTINGNNFLFNSKKIGELLSKEEEINKIFNKVKMFIECDYPFGLEIYRDINNIVFTCPKEICTNENKEVYRNFITEKLSKLIVKNLKGDLKYKIEISEKVSRNAHHLGEFLFSEKNPLKSNFNKIKNEWKKSGKICNICNIRPIDNSEKIKQRRMCTVCYERIAGRAETWNSEKNNTIWLDEVADCTGTLALITGRFNLRKWITGEHISTFRNRKEDLIKFKELNEYFSDISINKDKKIEDIKVNIYDIYNRYSIKNIMNNNVAKLNFDKFEKLILDDKDLMKGLKDSEKLTLAFWRKTPSFARIRRVWETTKTFFEECVIESYNLTGTKNNRIKFKLKNKIDSLEDNNAYEIKIDNLTFTAFYTDKDKPEFTIIENLDHLYKKLKDNKLNNAKDKNCNDCIRNHDIIKFLEGKSIEISTKGEKEKTVSSITSAYMDMSSYYPVINVLSDPDKFMILVPADKAFDIAKYIKEKYEKEMGKVRNRLPLNLGVVYSHFHTALPALMDAGNRLIQEKKKEFTEGDENQENEFIFKVRYKFINNNKGGIRLHLENNHKKRITVDIPNTMGDKNITDIWYPYFFIRKGYNSGSNPVEDRHLSFKGPDGRWLVHVDELQECDEIDYEPSYFDYQYLYSAAERFEIHYDENGIRKNNLLNNRPYYLEEIDDMEKLWKIIEKHLSNTQVKKIVEMVEAKRTEWIDKEGFSEIFKQFVGNVVKNCKWKEEPSEPDIQTIIDFAISGMLRDVAEIKMSIMKEKI